MVIETQTRQVVTLENKSAPASNCESRWCPTCAAAVVMVTPENGNEVAGVSARAIYRLLKSGKVHFAETHEGVLLVCLSSLANYETTDTLDLEVKTVPRSSGA